MPLEKEVEAPGAAEVCVQCVGSHKPGLFELSGTDPLENSAFNLRSWRRLPSLSDEVKITSV